MEVELGVSKKGFLTQEMREVTEDTEFSFSFMYKDRDAKDANQRKCTICGATFKANDPVTQIRSCGHIFHAECYLKRCIVSRCRLTARLSLIVECVERRQTRAISPNRSITSI